MQKLLFALISVSLLFVLYRLLILRARHRFLKDEAFLYSTKHQYRQVVPADFPHLDMEFYDMAGDWLTRHGFAVIADLEDFTIAYQRPAMRYFFRVMVGDGGGSVVRIFQLKPKNLWGAIQYRAVGIPVGSRILEFSTELENGTFIITSNAEATDRSGDAPGIVRTLLPESTTLDQLVEAHRESVLNTLMGKNTRTRSLDNANTIADSLHRLQHVLNAGRGTAEEAAASTVGGRASSPALAEAGRVLSNDLEDTGGLEDSRPAAVPGQASIDPASIEIALDDLGDDGGDLTTRWNHFCTALRRTIDSTQVPYEMLVAVTKHGSEIGIGRMRGEKPYLCFKRPDEAGELENFQPYYLEGASYDPPFSRIEAIVVGLDHNRVLYVLLEFLEENEAEERFSISFDPDWDQPTILYLGADLDAGKPQPYDTRRR